MDKILIFSLLIVCISKHGTYSMNLPGPLVYVVTPSPRPPGGNDEGRSAPFYYNNWMRRMDPPPNATSTTTQAPDLIFAEFESGNQMKSIRKLLEKEKVQPKTTSSTTTTTTTSRPIYVPDASEEVPNNVKFVSQSNEKKKDTEPDMTDYFALYNNLYNPNSEEMAPVYKPSSSSTTTTSTTTSTHSPAVNLENIWHIIDSQKYDQYPGKWEEESLGIDDKVTTSENPPQLDDESKTENQGQQEIDDNFALPEFATNPGNGAENESRAIRTEPNMRFPYINLKPFQMKTQKKPVVNYISSSKKGNNMFTNLDNFYDIKNPVRGEAEDVVPMRQPIDRYNPAQPYLPDYGTKSKQSSPSAPPTKAVANLVPPPPPPPPKISDGNFPSPSSYESFPPYAPSAPPVAPSPPPAPVPKPSLSYQPPVDMSDDSGPDSAPDNNDDGPPMDLGYRYKPPSPPVQPFLPTIPPLVQPSGGYSFDKPPMSKPFLGYSYDKPEITKPFSGYSYDKPPVADDSPPDNSDDKPDFQGYHYSKPEAPDHHDHHPASYGHDTPSYGPDYPELIFNKPNGGKGFPHDFPGDLKFYHDFDDHDFHHHHHHHTTTTTTEMPRVNRYSYYYLGKKLYYLPLYFSVYFIVYVGALIIKAVLRHKIVYPNSWRPNDQTASFFSKRSVNSWDTSNENLHEITGKVTHAIAVAGEKYLAQKKKK